MVRHIHSQKQCVICGIGWLVTAVQCNYQDSYQNYKTKHNTTIHTTLIMRDWFQYISSVLV
jgi:hypothetical protein